MKVFFFLVVKIGTVLLYVFNSGKFLFYGKEEFEKVQRQIKKHYKCAYREKTFD